MPTKPGAGPDFGNLPPPSAELVLIGVLFRAHLRTISRKRRAAFLAEVEASFDLFEREFRVPHLRPYRDRAELEEARARAAAWFAAALEVLAG